LGTGDVVDDIYSFLTPEVLSRSQSNERMSVDAREDEEQEDVQYIQPPSQHYVSPFQGDRPVSDDAELITIDDSDEEEGARQMEGNQASPQSEKDELCDSPREPDSDVIDTSSVSQEPLVEPLNFEQASQPVEGLQMPGSDITQEQDGKLSSPLPFSLFKSIIHRGNIGSCQLEQSSCVPYRQACISIRTSRDAFS
jgi:hypothetical protein